MGEKRINSEVISERKAAGEQIKAAGAETSAIANESFND